MGPLIVAVFLLIIGGMAGLLLGDWLDGNVSEVGRDDRRYRDAIALARAVLNTPDALDLRDRAREIVDRHEAATNRKDT